MLTLMQMIYAVVGFVLLCAAIVLLVLSLIGCTAADDGEQSGPLPTGSAVAFSVSADGSTTRGGATRTAQGTITVDGAGGTVSLQSQGFGVFACHTGTHPYVSTSTTANLLYNQLVTYDNVNSVWQYSPLVYWPNSTEDAGEYVSFFAYGPHSTNATGCIADMSRSDEVGDPWILYQLGGTDNNWQTSQVDLVYCFLKDQTRKYPITSNVVEFDFKHALACIGDRITVSCDESVTTRLKGLYIASNVELTITSINIDYLLTPKGRLVLNNNSEPNWQAVESGNTKVHRYLSFSPNLVMAQATSSSAVTTTSFESDSGQGIFYIPVESGSEHQQVTVSIGYRIATAAETIHEGTLRANVALSYVARPSEQRDINVTLSIPDVAGTRSAGGFISSHDIASNLLTCSIHTSQNN